MPGTQANRFEALDLLRGLAALAVVAFHVPHTPGALSLVPRGYLAVDLFFALSGFVLAHAYGAELARGGNIRKFMVQRLIRLYPLYLIALLAGALLALNALVLDGMPPLSYTRWAQALGANLFFLPGPADETRLTAALFPALFPAWSLMWELAANLLFALLAPRLGKRLLGTTMLLGLALVALVASSAGTLNGGAEWPAFWNGGARVLWSFFAGIALFRLHERLDWRFALPDWLLAAALIAAFLITGGSWGYDLALAAVGFPLLVLLAARARTTPASRAVGHWLGWLSYGVYVVQAPALTLLDKFSVRLFGLRLSDQPILPATLAALLLTLGLALLVTRRVDEPARAWLKRALRPQPTPTTTSPAAP